MADLMTFPNTWEEYERSYGFTDTEEIYTNGARLIPSFRVEQWLEHIAQPDLSSYSDKLWRAAYERGIEAVSEPKRGYWLMRDGRVICSRCENVPYNKIEYDGAVVYHIPKIAECMKYCPICGARMK